MKKKLIVVFVLLMAAVLFLSSCDLFNVTTTDEPDKPGDETTEPHEHAWNEGVVTTNPTCKDEGVKTYTCTKCGETKTEAIAKTSSHTWDAGVVTTAATCTAEGVKTYTCAVCGETKTESIAKNVHSWNAGAITTAATCTAEGVKTYTCAVCGETKTESIAKNVHSWNAGAITTAATCTTDGVKTYTCILCGETKTESIAKNAHSWNAGVITTEATCTTDGVKTYTCILCGETKTESIAKNAHSWNAGVITTEATCTTEGVKTYTCTLCGETKTESIAKSAHSWNEGEVTTPASCNKKGTRIFTCNSCGATKTETIPMIAHTEVIDAAVAATATTTGLTEGKHCAVCNEVLVAQTVVPALGYNVTFKDWNGTVLKSQNVQAGSSATAPSNPTRTGYDFTGWDKTFSNVTTDLTVTAQYTIKTYTVTFKDYDGTVLKVETVDYGASATAPSNPVRSGYIFKSWDKAFSNITSQLTITALYDELVVPKIVVNNATVAMNASTVTVTINLKNNTGISAMQFIVAYDEVLTLKSVTFDPAFGAYVTAPTPYQNPQSVTFISPLAEVNASGTFATLTFNIANVTEQTKANITLTIDTDNTYDENFDEVEFIVENGIVTIG